ncbi:MAG TPA: flagellar biosynthesis protein FlgJ [Desulfuromonadales bacterium]|nr:flagellar biosynthesis protein FlgJ [Desulfuromonadales bacterium]
MESLISPTMPDVSGNAAGKVRMLQQQARGASVLTEKQRAEAKKVSQDFEALFVGMMMKSMRSTVGKDKLTGGGHGEEVYRSLLDQEYANASVKRGAGLGLAKIIEKDIIRQESRKRAPINVPSIDVTE